MKSFKKKLMKILKNENVTAINGEMISFAFFFNFINASVNEYFSVKSCSFSSQIFLFQRTGKINEYIKKMKIKEEIISFVFSIHFINFSVNKYFLTSCSLFSEIYSFLGTEKYQWKYEKCKCYRHS